MRRRSRLRQLGRQAFSQKMRIFRQTVPPWAGNTEDFPRIPPIHRTTRGLRRPIRRFPRRTDRFRRGGPDAWSRHGTIFPGRRAAPPSAKETRPLRPGSQILHPLNRSHSAPETPPGSREAAPPTTESFRRTRRNHPLPRQNRLLPGRNPPAEQYSPLTRAARRSRHSCTR